MNCFKPQISIYIYHNRFCYRGSILIPTIRSSNPYDNSETSANQAPGRWANFPLHDLLTRFQRGQGVPRRSRKSRRRRASRMSADIWRISVIVSVRYRIDESGGSPTEPVSVTRTLGIRSMPTAVVRRMLRLRRFFVSLEPITCSRHPGHLNIVSVPNSQRIGR